MNVEIENADSLSCLVCPDSVYCYPLIFELQRSSIFKQFGAWFHVVKMAFDDTLIKILLKPQVTDFFVSAKFSWINIFDDSTLLFLAVTGSFGSAYVTALNIFKQYCKSNDLPCSGKLCKDQGDGLHVSKVKSNESVCLLCKINQSDCTFLECGHSCACVSCLKSIVGFKNCPICKRPVAQVMLVF